MDSRERNNPQRGLLQLITAYLLRLSSNKKWAPFDGVASSLGIVARPLAR